MVSWAIAGSFTVFLGLSSIQEVYMLVNFCFFPVFFCSPVCDYGGMAGGGGGMGILAKNVEK